MGMASQVIRNGPLNVLVALAGADGAAAQILPALQPHYALVCSDPAQAVEAARQFEPDVVLIDCRVPDPSALIRSFSAAAGARNIVFVAMPFAAGPVPAGFHYSLPVAATASELEHLLWQIGFGRPIGGRSVAPPGTKMIG
jgi:CheY-like chemotaxis protein